MNTLQMLKKRLPSPPAAYRPVQIIHSHYPKSPADTKAYLDGAQALGMGGFVVNMDCIPQREEGETEEHYRTRRLDAYLGENTPETEAAWASLAAFMDACFARGMQIWIYDELAYPSGAAGHHVLRNHPEDQVKGLAFLRQSVSGKGQIKGEAGRLLCAIACPEEDGILHTARAHKIHAHDGIIEYDLPRGSWVIAAVYAKPIAFLTENKVPYPDLLREDVVDRFINVTHERYLRHLGAARIQKVTAFFTDEPGLPTHGCSSYFFESHAIEAYTEALEHEVPELKTRAIDLFAETDRDFAAFRHAYRSAVARRFERTYFARISAWCEKHGTALTGHLYGEETLSMQIGLNAGLFGLMRNMTVPGVDRLYCTDPRDVIAEKTAASAAHLYGKKSVMSENSFHLEHNFWHTPETATPENRLNSTFYQMQLGVTAIASYFGYPDLSRVTEEASALDDGRGIWEDRASRASLFIQTGTHSVPLLLLIPTKSANERFMPSDHKYWEPGPCTVAPYQPMQIKHLEEIYGRVLNILCDTRRDFDLIDDIGLQSCTIRDGGLQTESEAFSHLLFFDDGKQETQTEETLARFLAAGGRVLAVTVKDVSPFARAMKARYPDTFCSLSAEPGKDAEMTKTLCERIPPVVSIIAPPTVRARRTCTPDATLYFLHNRGDACRICLKEQGRFTRFALEDGTATAFVSTGEYALDLPHHGVLMLVKET